jgi:hypothetical protein
MNTNSDPFRSISLVFLILICIMLWQMHDRGRQELKMAQLIWEEEITIKNEQIADLQQLNVSLRQEVGRLKREEAELKDRLATELVEKEQLTSQVKDLSGRLIAAIRERDHAVTALDAQQPQNTISEAPCTTHNEAENVLNTDSTQVSLRAMTIAGTTAWSWATTGILGLFLLLGWGSIHLTKSKPARFSETAAPKSHKQSSLQPLILRPINNSSRCKPQ